MGSREQGAGGQGDLSENLQQVFPLSPFPIPHSPFLTYVAFDATAMHEPQYLEWMDNSVSSLRLF